MDDSVRDRPVEPIYIDKDQADCLLIILTEWSQNLEKNLPNVDLIAMENFFMKEKGITREQATTRTSEYMALNTSLLQTIPGILTEIKEIYPILDERSNPSKIIKPIWMNK